MSPRHAGQDQQSRPTQAAEVKTKAKPEIYPIYWSPAQMQARQSDRMARVQSFLNRLWTSESDGVQWFDPDRDSLYPDRIRRRPPGADSGGLGTHLDPGTLDLWMTKAYQKAFRHLFEYRDLRARPPSQWLTSLRGGARQCNSAALGRACPIGPRS